MSLYSRVGDVLRNRHVLGVLGVLGQLRVLGELRVLRVLGMLRVLWVLGMLGVCVSGCDDTTHEVRL